MVTLGSLKFVLTLARLYIKPPLGKGMPTLGDRGGPSLSRFLHTVSSAVSIVRVVLFRLLDFQELSDVTHPTLVWLDTFCKLAALVFRSPSSEFPAGVAGA